MAELRDRLTLDYWREHVLEAAYIGFGLIAFLIFMVASFPYDQALSAALGPAGLALEYSDRRLQLPLGATLDNVRLVSLNNPGPPILQTDQLRLAPTFASILIGRPGVRISADIYNGTVKATVRRAGNELRISFAVDALELRRYRGLVRLGASAEGQLSGSGWVAIAPNGPAASSGDVDLEGKSLIIRIGSGLPPIAFTDLKGSIRLDDGVLEIKRLTGSGTDGTLDAHGAIRLAPDLRASQIALSLKIDPTPGGRARLGFLLGLLPHPPGPQPYNVRGSLLTPKIS